MTPVPNASGSTSTTRPNSGPLAGSGVGDRTHGPPAKVGSPITQAMPSGCVAGQVSSTAGTSAPEPCTTGRPLLRTDTGTLASGSAAIRAAEASNLIARR
ncbi:hypothetical protein ACE1SV_63720 [Streptomyces sennicomposti]